MAFIEKMAALLGLKGVGPMVVMRFEEIGSLDSDCPSEQAV